MSQFISIVEQGDGSVHLVHKDHLVQIVHVPGSPVATVTTSDGKSFRIAEADFKQLTSSLNSADR